MTSHLRTHGVHVEYLSRKSRFEIHVCKYKRDAPPPPANPPCIYGCTLAVGGWQSCQNPISMAPDKIWILFLGKRRCSRRLTLIIDGWRDNPGLGEDEGGGGTWWKCCRGLGIIDLEYRERGSLRTHWGGILILIGRLSQVTDWLSPKHNGTFRNTS